MQDDYRRCPGCETVKPLSHFSKDRWKPGGYAVYCKTCGQIDASDPPLTNSERDRRRGKGAQQYDAARRLLDEIKARPCTDCGGTFPPYVMHFDHRDPAEKRNNVSAWVSARCIPQMLSEIEACDLVCANCHAIRTHEQQQARIFPRGGRPRRSEWPTEL